MDPVFYIHIGIPKTATTTIQRFFTDHREILRKRGILYPSSVASSDGHSELHRALSLAVEPESVPRMSGLPSRLVGTDVVGMLFDEVASTGAKIIILSAESLAYMKRPLALRLALKSYPVRILLYLRRQDSFLASYYNQIIKSRLYAASFEEFLQQCAANRIAIGQKFSSLELCDYSRFLDLWADAFGRSNILPGIYEDFDVPNGAAAILGDFANKVGIDIRDLSLPLEDTNPGLNASSVALKRRVNGMLATEQERVFSEVLFMEHGCDRKEGRLSPDQIQANVTRRNLILAQYEESNTSVAQRYFSGRTRLFDSPAEKDSLLPDSCEGDWEHHGLAVNMIAQLISRAAAVPEA